MSNEYNISTYRVSVQGSPKVLSSPVSHLTVVKNMIREKQRIRANIMMFLPSSLPVLEPLELQVVERKEGPFLKACIFLIFDALKHISLHELSQSTLETL